MFSKEIDLNKLEGKNKWLDWATQGGFATQPKSYWTKGIHEAGAKNTNIEEDGKQVYLDENNNKTFKKTKTKLKRYPLKTGGSILNNDPNFNDSRVNQVPARKGIFANVIQRDAILNKYEEDGGKFLPASEAYQAASDRTTVYGKKTGEQVRSEEHTSELQSRLHLVCRLLLDIQNRSEEHTSELQSRIHLV